MLKTLTRSLLVIATLLLGQMALADDSTSRRPLFFFLFLHDDVKETDTERLVTHYFAWLVKDLESFTGRRVHMQFLRGIPTLTDFAYKGGDSDAIYGAWKQRVDQYLNAQNLPRNGTTKYLLVTQDKIDSSTLGFTVDKGYTGIASLDTYTAAAHELGHMLGGTHELAKVLYRDGWWCETNLVAVRQVVRANCYVYSDKNKQRIAANLSEYP
ncbi:hypothetical protein G7013_22165 [Pseudomonas viridiflava]|uniref:Uncharacterized protein n=1 Tax=Pseudomonas viridiflava TaxID=33069 RepID=A0A3M5NZ54_PSEVI|nr:hypothetical protein [Pseudomonas viridiflava]MBA1232357.1 hypothetical protein [Pseudomonas viridiflava]RMT77574.1 hypothetical protein ALP40_04577 [Pseudomonas viridiflava]